MKDKKLKRTLICMSFMVAGSMAQAASFDCTKSSTPIEKAICSDSQLSDLDSQLMQSYNRSLSNSANADSLKSEQRTWLVNIRNNCQDSACMRQAYTARIAALDVPTTATASNGITGTSAPAATPARINPSAQSQEASNTKTAEKSNAVSPQASQHTAMQGKASPTDTSTPKKTPPSLEKPDAGIAGIFNGIYTLLVGIFLIGLIKPKWIVRWGATPSRKKVVAYFLAVALPFGVLGEFTKNKATRAYEAKIRADKEAEHAAILAREKAIAEERQARRANELRAVEARRQELTQPRPMWQRYYMAINANGYMCEQYKSVIMNWRNNGLDDNQLNQLADDIFAQARQAGCVE